MPTNWQTVPVQLGGGIILNEDWLSQGVSKQGSALRMINFEPGLRGGYRRVGGYSKWINSAVPGTGNILGLAVFNDGVLACRGDDVYFSTGGTWGSAVNTSARTGAGRYLFDQYRMAGNAVITMVDGVNKPAKYDGTTYTVLSNAPTGASCVAMFKNHLFFGKGRELTFSAPSDDTDYTTVSGGGVLNVSDTIVNIKVFREFLIVFCQNRILKVAGNNKDDFVVSAITNKIGCLSAHSVQEINGDLIYLTADGIRPISATERIGDFEIGSLSRGILPLIEEDLRTQAVDQWCSLIYRSKTQYRLFKHKTGLLRTLQKGYIGGLGKRNMGGAEINPAWEWGETKGFEAVAADSGYINDAEYLFHGDTSGYVYRHEDGNSFDGDNVEAIYQTAHMIFGDPESRKTFYKVRHFLRAQGVVNINMALVYDWDQGDYNNPPAYTIDLSNTNAAYYDVAVYDTDVYDASDLSALTTNVEGSGRAVSLVFTSNDTNPSYELQALSISLTMRGKK